MNIARKLMDPVYGNLPEINMSIDGVINRDIDMFAWADPFYPDPCIPEHVKVATIEAIQSGNTHYSLPIGRPELRKAIADMYNKKGFNIHPDKNVIITNGSDMAFIYAIRPFMVPGELNAVLTHAPSYGNNFTPPIYAGGQTVIIPTYPENNYDLETEEFENKLTDKTKMVLLTNPNNPTTTVYKRSTLEKLSKFIIKNNLILIVDECFSDLTFDGHEMVHAATLEGMAERTITISSFSKNMALCGYRVAYIIAPSDIMSVLYATCIEYVGAVNTAAQMGVLAGIKDMAFVEEYRQEFQKRGEITYNLFKDIPNVSCIKPESSFFIWLDVRNLGTAKEVRKYILDTAYVDVFDGEKFGPPGENCIRIVYGSLRNHDKCIEVLKRIQKALSSHPKSK